MFLDSVIQFVTGESANNAGMCIIFRSNAFE